MAKVTSNALGSCKCSFEGYPMYSISSSSFFVKRHLGLVWQQCQQKSYNCIEILQKKFVQSTRTPNNELPRTNSVTVSYISLTHLYLKSMTLPMQIQLAMDPFRPLGYASSAGYKIEWIRCPSNRTQQLFTSAITFREPCLLMAGADLGGG